MIKLLSLKQATADKCNCRQMCASQGGRYLHTDWHVTCGRGLCQFLRRDLPPRHPLLFAVDDHFVLCMATKNCLFTFSVTFSYSQHQHFSIPHLSLFLCPLVAGKQVPHARIQLRHQPPGDGLSGVLFHDHRGCGVIPSALPPSGRRRRRLFLVRRR